MFDNSSDPVPWADLDTDAIKARLATVVDGGEPAMRAAIGELTLEAGMLLGDVHTTMEIVGSLSEVLGDAWGVANASKMLEILEDWRARSFDLVGDNYPEL